MAAIEASLYPAWMFHPDFLRSLVLRFRKGAGLREAGDFSVDARLLLNLLTGVDDQKRRASGRGGTSKRDSEASSVWKRVRAAERLRVVIDFSGCSDTFFAKEVGLPVDRSGSCSALSKIYAGTSRTLATGLDERVARRFGFDRRWFWWENPLIAEPRDRMPPDRLIHHHANVFRTVTERQMYSVASGATTFGSLGIDYGVPSWLEPFVAVGYCAPDAAAPARRDVPDVCCVPPPRRDLVCTWAELRIPTKAKAQGERSSRST